MSTSIKDQVSAQEWQTRVELAAIYRMVAHYRWDDLVFTHLTAKIPGADKHFLINPYGLMFEEVTASNLVKVDQDCNKIIDTPHPVNPAGFLIHSTIHMASEDAHFVLHTHTADGVGVACQKNGLLPISQQAMTLLANMAYHDYEGIAVNEAERESLVRDLGNKKLMMLRNHGLVATGKTAGDAFLNLYSLERACTIQIKAQSGGGELIPLPEKAIATVREQVKKATLNSYGGICWDAVVRKVERLYPDYCS